MTASPPRRRRLRVLGSLAALGGLVGTGFALTIHLTLTGSLPTLSGVAHLDGLSAPARVDRDALGVPSLHAATRLDLARATGFVHGQDRFFQMDLLRRQPAGELAALFGPLALGSDVGMRTHRFRARARQRLAAGSSDERALLRAYADGVEAGRGSLRASPWEYHLLRTNPEPWTEEDTILVAMGMQFLLQQGGIGREKAQGILEDVLPPALAKFLTPAGSPWDAPMLGDARPGPTIPDASEIDLRTEPTRWRISLPPAVPASPIRPGSNNWAVAGSRSTHGGAIVANDMHLGLYLPNTWYRVALHWKDGDEDHRAVGVTLPGTPALIVGSTGHLAWGFTNTEGDFTDIIDLESDMKTYATPDGPQPFVRHEEVIRVNGGRSHTHVVLDTIWGPVAAERGPKGQMRVVRCVPQQPEAFNLELMRLETARTLEEALAIAPRAGTPAQNFVVADRHGGIAYTVIGMLPRRVGFDGRRPTSWADGSRRWAGWVPPEDYPRILRPAEGLLWTANNRVVGTPWLARVGLGNYDHGARAKQIRDGLRAKEKLSERDLLAIQLDDRALFLERWQKLLVEQLTPEAVGDNARRAALRQAVVDWGGRAVPESVGFRVVRRWAGVVRMIVLRSLTAPCARADNSFSYQLLDGNVEESVWQLVTKQPPHLLPPGFASWNGLLLDALDRVGAEAQGKAADLDLSRFTWGEANRPRIQHPLGGALGPLADFYGLNMSRAPLPGDSRGMPRIQAPADGASERLAVSPGREAEGYFHMPGGQSGHPLSPHYRDGHAAWAEGRPTPFLPGAAVQTLELRPR